MVFGVDLGDIPFGAGLDSRSVGNDKPIDVAAHADAEPVGSVTHCVTGSGAKSELHRDCP